MKDAKMNFTNHTSAGSSCIDQDVTATFLASNLKSTQMVGDEVGGINKMKFVSSPENN